MIFGSDAALLRGPMQTLGGTAGQSSDCFQLGVHECPSSLVQSRLQSPRGNRISGAGITRRRPATPPLSSLTSTRKAAKEGRITQRSCRLTSRHSLRCSNSMRRTQGHTEEGLRSVDTTGEHLLPVEARVLAPLCFATRQGEAIRETLDTADLETRGRRRRRIGSHEHACVD